jgi:hypothetical protein
MSEVPALAPVVAAVRAAGMRLQGLVPAEASGPSHVIAYRWPEEGGARFERAELAVAPEEVVAAALAVVGEATSTDGLISDLLV